MQYRCIVHRKLYVGRRRPEEESVALWIIQLLSLLAILVISIFVEYKLAMDGSTDSSIVLAGILLAIASAIISLVSFAVLLTRGPK